MPLVFVQRYAPAAGIAAGTGIQYVNGVLNLEASPIYVDFDPDLWAGVAPGDSYTIFSGFTSLSGSVSNLVAGTLPAGVSGASFSQVGSTIVVTFS